MGSGYPATPGRNYCRPWGQRERRGLQPDGDTLTTAGADSTLQLWGADGVARRPEPITLDSAASSLGYTPAGQLVVGTSDGQVELRDGQGELVSASGQPPSLSPQMEGWLRNVQNLPKNTWWILAAIPVLLILLGLLSALLGGRRRAKDEELILDVAPTPELDINFSALGQMPPPPTPEALPPEASLVPVEGGALDGSSPSKLEQARADLAEGKRLMREERYEQSLLCFNSAIEATEVERLKAEATGAPLGALMP
ncbi:MAG: hypothetical protein HC929_18580 [Leptolyngbyaceae cyanobacterium SM2_5_2]|nr:hypothetical protein [Leptolyngbyaceae cyanobacterium SM2_5_2]